MSTGVSIPAKWCTEVSGMPARNETALQNKTLKFPSNMLCKYNHILSCFISYALSRMYLFLPSFLGNSSPALPNRGYNASFMNTSAASLQGKW